jgi:hypothetical protein
VVRSKRVSELQPVLEKTMKRIIALALAASATGAALAQPSIGVSIGINQPGVYGRIDIGDIPRPALVYAQPMIIAPPPVVLDRRPIYLYVPAPHQQDWRRYCGRYNACGQPVYFVQDRWVRERYEHEHPGWEHGHHNGWDKHDDDGKHGKGKSNGKGQGKDHRD